MATPTSLPGSFSDFSALTALQMNDLRGAFRILQVASTTKTDTFTVTSSSYTDVTGLSVTITPRSTSSNIFVLASLSATGQSATTNLFSRLVRGSTAIGIGDAAGNRIRSTSNARDQQFPSSLILAFLDSPATTSATTYKVQVTNQSTGVIYVNRSEVDTDASFSPRGISTITVFEVSA